MLPIPALIVLGAAFAAGYLLGSIPFAFLVERWKGVDLRKVGTGNIGASNAYIVAGKIPGVMVLLGDAGKGIAAVLLVGSFTDWNHAAMATAAVGAVIGHDWSLYLGLHGGKGTATTVGVILALDWRVLAMSVAVYFLLLGLSRLIVISSLLTVAAMPAMMMLRPWWLPAAGPEPTAFVWGAVILACLGYLRHWDHVERFLQGREPRAGEMVRASRRRD